MHEHAVAHFDSNFHEILMRPMHGVARLERGHARPAESRELRAGLLGRFEQCPIARLESAVAEHTHRTGEIDIALLHDHAYARMICVLGLEHGHALVILVDAVLFADGQYREHRSVVRIDERDLLADCDLIRGRGIRRQSNRNRPKRSVRNAHVIADATPIRLRHESLQRREAADAEHHDIPLLARCDRQPPQCLGVTELGRARTVGYLKWAQIAAAVRRYESGHINYLLGEQDQTSPYRMTSELCDEIVDGAINLVEVISNVAHAPRDPQESALPALKWRDEDMHRLG